MHYFISENIFAYNSGTEHAQARRVRLFNQAGVSAQYVTRDYNRFWYRDAEKLGLTAAQVLNMYDYFQETTAVPYQKLSMHELPQLPFADYHLTSHGPNYATIDYAGRQLARINVMPATVGLVNEIIYYDRLGHQTVRENFDWRGFKSSIDYFHPDGTLAVQKFLNLAGQPVLEIIHMDVNGQRYPTMWKLLGYKGHDWRFNSQDQLFLFFLNEISLENPGANLFSERRTMDNVIADVQYAAHKYAILHDIHTGDALHPQTAPLHAVYQPLLEQRLTNFDAIFVPTRQQQRDLQQRYPQGMFKVAPDTVLLHEQTTELPRHAGEIIFVGRLSPEKRPEQAITALATIVKRVPEATLVLHGYATSPAYLQELQDTVTKFGLEQHVRFGPYITGKDLQHVYQQAKVIVQTSIAEGFGMNLVEAMGCGVPVVTYDLNYGAHELITDGVEGYIVANGDNVALANRVSAILSDEVLWQQMSQAALVKAQQWAADTVMQAWQAALVE